MSLILTVMMVSWVYAMSRLIIKSYPLNIYAIYYLFNTLQQRYLNKDKTGYEENKTRARRGKKQIKGKFENI